MSVAPKLDNVQVLRGVAAVIVVVSHISKEMVQRGVGGHVRFLLFLESGQFGVDIFFIISGFIMYYLRFFASDGLDAASEFILKRLIRVVPLYWFYSLLVLGPMVALPRELSRHSFSNEYIVASFLFIPMSRPGRGDLGPLLELGWTMNYEIFFYLVVAALIAVRATRPLFWVSLFFFGLFLLGLLVPRTWEQIWYWSRSVILEFAFGMAIAAAFLKRVAFPGWVGVVMLLLGIGIWQLAPLAYPVTEPEADVRGFTWGVAAALITGALLLSPLSSVLTSTADGIMRRIGDSSYSLYLSHMFVVRSMTLLLGTTLLTRPLLAWIYLPVTMAACVALAGFSYRLIEVPTMRALRAALLPRRPIAI